jgi:flavin reductase (DIM6/NTAB) family NADH-FMN oxidoreductase RutF
MTDIDKAAFRDLCGRFATGVTIVTAFDQDGRPAGMTVSSFASISLEPPLISVAIDHAASAFGALDEARVWAVNILESNQEALSRRFSAVARDRFEGVDWRRGDGGELLLGGVLAHLVCERHESIPAGDHTILVGRVIGGSAADHGSPLLYYRGGYAGADGL